MKQEKDKSIIVVTQAFLHQAVVWPGIIGSEKTLSKVKGMTMTLVPQGIRLDHDKKPGEFAIIPSPNIALLTISKVD